MGTITPNVMVQILGGNTMTARRKAKRKDHSAWVGVVSLEPPRIAYLNSVDVNIECSLLVRVFEIADDALNYDDVDDSALLDSERFKVNGFQDLQRLMDRLGVDTSTLAFKAETQYPL